ncbi:MAG: MFS transporter [Acidobacteriota bacterium]|jgi:MFS family permease|nr:MFS transporter [Acidobacteriota bacterium]
MKLRRSVYGRDFVLASLAYFFVFLSTAVFYLFPLYLDQFHPSKSRVGLIMGIHSVTAILVRPLFGRVLDKRGGRKVAMVGMFIILLSIPGFYLVDGAGWLALVLRAINGVGWGVGTTALMAICSELSPPEKMAQSLGIIGAAGIVAGAAGPLLAEEIFLRVNFHAVFTVGIIMAAAAILCVYAIREKSADARQAAVSSAGAGRSAGLGRYSFLILAVIAVMPVAHGAARGTVLNFIALFGASIGFDRIAPFFLVFSVAAILTRVGIGDISDRYGRKRVIFPSAVMIGLNLFWIAGTHSYIGFLATGFVAGLGQGLIFPALSTYVIDFLGRENKGLALGLYLSLFDLGMGLGSPLWGWVSDGGLVNLWVGLDLPAWGWVAHLAGYRAMYAIAGGLTIVLTLLFTWKAPAASSVES